MYYKEYGNKNGQLVVFIHGGFTTNESFCKQYNLLPDKRMIFVDLPGCGKSEKIGEKAFSFNQSAVELIKLIQQLSPDRKVILIAHSYGGLVAKAVIAKRPEIVDKVVIGSTNIKKSVLFWLYTRKLGCHILWKQNKDRYMKDGTTWECVCDMQKDAWDNFNFNIPQQSMNISALFIVAEKDIKEIHESMKLWHTKFKSSKLFVVEDTGHNYFMEAPEKVNYIVKTFCNGCS